MAIYARHHNHRGIAGVHINRGFLRLDAGDLECAAAEAAEAFRHGEEKHDYIVMARARTLECIIENAAFEEQVGEPARHHEAAEMFARDAVEYADHTENRRLLARAHIWQGSLSRPGPTPTWRRPAAAANRRAPCCQPEGDGAPVCLGRAGDGLKAPCSAPGPSMPPCGPGARAWWRTVVPADDRGVCAHRHPQGLGARRPKVSRVAERLSISPKKVRRILHAAGVRAIRYSRRKR